MTAPYDVDGHRLRLCARCARWFAERGFSVVECGDGRAWPAELEAEAA